MPFHAHVAGRVLRRGASALLDLLALLLLSAIATILATGGGSLELGELTVSARRVTNPLVGLSLVIALRSIFLWTVPVWFTGVSPSQIGRSCWRLCRGASTYLSTLSHRHALLWVAGILATSAVIKTLNAYYYFGFYSGDDVEIHEMTFAYMFDWDWRAWELRSSFYPFVFILPLQSLAVALGTSEPAALVFLGRLVVVVASLGALWCVFAAGRQLIGTPGGGVLACVVLALSKTHTTFASTELPRSVAAAFLMLAFVSSSSASPSIRAAGLSGAWVGLAGLLRYSELVFVVPEALRLVKQKLVVHALAFLAAAAVTAGGLMAASDFLYWQSPGSSVKNIVDYTLIKGLSSRGHEPWHFYFSQLGTWTNPVWLAASVYSIRLGYWRLAGWTWLPVIVLSCLPHKEARYMVPVLPFLSLGAAIGLHHWWRALGDRTGDRAHQTAFLLTVACCLCVVFELGGFRFRRSEGAVLVARAIAPLVAGRTLLAEQPWRLGGRLYFDRNTRVIDVTGFERGELVRRLRDDAVTVVALKAERPMVDAAELGSIGFKMIATEPRSGYLVYVRSSP